MEHLQLVSEPLAFLGDGVCKLQGPHALLTQGIQLPSQPLDLMPGGIELRGMILLLEWRIENPRRITSLLVWVHVTENHG